MCNPLLQGVVSDLTNFIVTNFEKVDIDESWTEIDSIEGAEDCFIDDVLPHDHGSDSSLFSLQFLAIDSTLSDSDAELSEEPSFHFSVPLLTDSDSDTEVPAQQPNGNTRPPPRVIRPVEFEPLVLATPVSAARLSPRPEEGEDELHRVFIGIYALSRLGIFSGDWVGFVGVGLNGERVYLTWFCDNENEKLLLILFFGGYRFWLADQIIARAGSARLTALRARVLKKGKHHLLSSPFVPSDFPNLSSTGATA